MRFVDVMMKGLKTTFRNRKGLAFMLLFPVMFMFIFRVSFGWGAPENATYDIAVLNLDDGQGPWDTAEPAWMPAANAAMGTNLTAAQYFDQVILNGSANAGEQFIQRFLTDAKYDDGKTLLFKVRNVTTYEEGEKLVQDGDVAAIVIIPANLSSALQGVVDSAVVTELRAHSIPTPDPLPGYANATIDLSGVTGNIDYAFASGMLQGYIGAYTQIQASIIRQAVGTGLPGGAIGKEGPDIRTAYVARGDTGEFVVFDWIAPGIIVFGLMMVTQWVTASLATEVKQKTINRLRITKMTAVDMMLGETLRWAVIGLVVTALLFGVAVAVGTHFAGDYSVTLPVAILIGLVIVLASIALGLMISAFVDDPEQASGLATLIIVPLSFFTGAFFDLNLAVTRYLPWTQGATALRQMLVYDNMGSAMTATAICFVGALVMFVVGVLLFHIRRLRGG
jgi:ABC-2 type transport system permease protein